jgi:hypothetical protein
MSYGITFNTDGSWSGRGKFPTTLKDMSDITKWVFKFFMEFNEVGNKYSQYMANDGVLVGQEKVNLVKELDDVIGGLLLFRSYISGVIEGNITSLENKFGYTFIFSYDELKWDGSGKIMNKYVFNIKNFKEWYNSVMIKLKEIFTRYLDSIKDKVLDDDDANKVYLLIDFIIFDIVVIEKKLMTTGINS